MCMTRSSKYITIVLVALTCELLDVVSTIYCMGSNLNYDNLGYPLVEMNPLGRYFNLGYMPMCIIVLFSFLSYTFMFTYHTFLYNSHSASIYKSRFLNVIGYSYIRTTIVAKVIVIIENFLLGWCINKAQVSFDEALNSWIVDISEMHTNSIINNLSIKYFMYDSDSLLWQYRIEVITVCTFLLFCATVIKRENETHIN